MIEWLPMRSIAAAATLLAAGAAAGANLLWNGDFGSDVSGWAVQEPPMAQADFSNLDATGKPDSGSMRIANVHPNAGQGQGVVQCIGPVTAGVSYSYGAKVMFPTGQTRTGSAQIGLRWHPGANCTGDEISQPRAQTPTPKDSWVVLNGGAVVAPAGTASAAFVAFTSKVQAGGQLVAFFDELYFEDSQHPSPNYQGLWWKAPAESEAGWGMNIAHQGDKLFATWFTYDFAGKPWWLAAVATKIATGVYSGELFTTTGPPFNAAPFDPGLVTETAAGTVKFTFTGDNRATVDYSVITAASAKAAVAQSKTITRQIFATPMPHCAWNSPVDYSLATNYQDLWWRFPGGFEAGWGINLTHQDDTIFATWFTYDLDGKPWWLAGVLQRVSSGVYAGDLFTTTGPAFNAVPFNPANVVETTVGTATITFTDGLSGTFEYTVNGITQSKPITRQVFEGIGTVCN